ncbi:OmpH family outer membrane protein [Daejeonella sp.]|uniref:OmpH family outer membrane protein n=1 Tax=Daejeonella sp. TaxID=2805397 RepID=UPI0025BB059C|nr:OmpH family outer membrane protein [Daejeonella sp.]
MKKIVIIALLLVLSSLGGYAQRFAYVDSDYILKHIPEYNSAQKQLDALSEQWQKEIDIKFANIEDMFKAYQADQVLLNPEMRKKREDEIVQKEQEAKEYQRLKFGFEGELFQVRSKLIKPIQDRVSKAIQAIADAQQLDMVFDKNSEITLLYANPRLDKSNEVITKLGYKPGANK